MKKLFLNELKSKYDIRSVCDLTRVTFISFLTGNLFLSLMRAKSCFASLSVNDFICET